MNESYNVFICYSSWSIETLLNFLNGYMQNAVGLTKIIKDFCDNETNKTIVVMKPELYDILLQHGYGVTRFEIDFKIKKYKFNENILPPADKSCNLFIPITKKTTETIVNSIINKKLEILAEFDIIPKKSWRIKCPINSRENGFIKLGCFIFFKSEISLYNIGIVKFLLNNTHWDEEGDNKYNNIIKCYWAKPRL